jgi:hypothetical protein
MAFLSNQVSAFASFAAFCADKRSFSSGRGINSGSGSGTLRPAMAGSALLLKRVIFAGLGRCLHRCIFHRGSK